MTGNLNRWRELRGWGRARTASRPFDELEKQDPAGEIEADSRARRLPETTTTNVPRPRNV